MEIVGYYLAILRSSTVLNLAEVNLRPDMTVGHALVGLHERVTDLVMELNELRRQGSHPGITNREIPGTDLEMNWAVHSTEDRKRVSTANILARVQSTRVSFLSLGRIYTPSSSASSTGSPGEITGYRGRESDDYYSLAPGKYRNIYCRLGKLGYRRALETDELEGATSTYTTTEISSLDDLSQRRLIAVTAGILDNVTAVELIRDGEPAQAVLAEMWKEATPTAKTEGTKGLDP